jgi:hypothetical protein
MKRTGIFMYLVCSLAIFQCCATYPPGPSIVVLPPAGKPFEVFQQEDNACRQWAASQVGWDANETANQNLASGATIGTLLGAGLGAAIGSASGNVGAGAGIGAAGGLMAGTAAGSNMASISAHEVQHRYDIAYLQCMHAKGNVVPRTVYPSGAPRFYPSPPPYRYYYGHPYYYPPPPAIYPYPPFP